MSLALVLIAAMPAQAHSTSEIDAWLEDWSHRAQFGLKPGMWLEFETFVERHHSHFYPQPVGRDTTYRGMGSSVEQWRGLVESFFPADAVQNMMCIMAGESGGNPNARNPSSGAAGLFQIMPFWWDHYGGDRYDPETNVSVARKVWDQQGYGAWSVWNRGKC